MSTAHAPLTSDELATLVRRLSPSRADAPRDEWVKIGMAIKSANSGDTGFALFDEFSRQSPKYKPSAVRDTWRSIRPDGGYTVGSLIRWANEDDPNGKPSSTRDSGNETHYSYTDANGQVLYQAIRYYRDGEKKFYQRRSDGQGGWLKDMQGVQRVLYRLPEVIQAVAAGKCVYIVEGEKDVETLRQYGLTATTNVGGAGKWKHTDQTPLTGGDLIAFPDNDPAGRDHVADTVSRVQSIARSVRVVTLPGLPEKGDVTDWLNAGNTIESLLELCDAAPEAEPVAPATEQPPADPAGNQSPIDRSFVLKCLNEDEAGDAQLLAELYRGQLCFDYAAGMWYQFAGHAWVPCDGLPRKVVWSKVAAIYMELAAHVQAESTTDESPRTSDSSKTADRLITRAKHLRSLRRTSNVLTLAQELLGIKGAEWDADPWILAVTNGVLDLRTGELRDGRSDDYIRIVAPTEWAGLDTPAPRWERFISEVLSNEPDRVAFLQRLLGFALNGTTKEHVLAVCVGERGRNGKRVLFETLQHVLGQYAGSISTDVLIGQDRWRGAGSAQPHLMALQGRRIAYASETGEHDQLSSAQVKNITGGDPITARHLHQNLITFTPTHTIFLQTNRKPQAPSDDDALWERVKVLEFKARFVDDPQSPDEHPRDPQLEEHLRMEAPGILAWLVRGGLDWLKGGLQTPASVKLARDKYRQEEAIDPFLEECCDEWDGGSAEGGALYEAYKQWCEVRSLRVKSAVWFGKQLVQRFEKARVTSGVNQGRTVYHGVSLRQRDDWTVQTPLQALTTLQQSINPSVGIGTPNTDDCEASTEGLQSFSKSSMQFFPHEEKNMKNPSNPSVEPEKTAEFRTTKPTEGFAAVDEDAIDWDHVRALLQVGGIPALRNKCETEWHLPLWGVMAGANKRYPSLDIGPVVRGVMQ